MTEATTVLRGRSEFSEIMERYRYINRGPGPKGNQLSFNSLKNRAYAKATTLLASKGIILTDHTECKPVT